MLRGHVFDEQLFSSECFALFIDTFLAKNCGVIKGCNLSNTTNSVTVSSGFFCVRGRFLEIEGIDTLTTGTDNAYCKLVCEIDLSKENTESELTQATLKIVKSTTGYPSLTQQDITYGGTIYQFEFAQFRTDTSGITDFKDTKNFLEFDSIYFKVNSETQQLIEKIQSELETVEDGSAYILKNNIAVVSANMTLVSGNASTELSYPTGFDKNNCIVLSVMVNNSLNTDTKFAYGFFPSPVGYTTGAISKIAILRNEDIAVKIGNPAEGSHSDGSWTYEVKVYLMKIN